MSEPKDEDSNANGGHNQDETRKEKKTIASRAKELWGKTGITWRVYKLMFKGALAPTIVTAAYQSNAWAYEYTTLGYLVGIMTILSVVIQPRAKFLQTMLVQVFLTCLAAAWAALGCYLAIRARINSEGFTGPGTGGPGTSGTAARGSKTAPYNSSASAVAGVWLFASIYGISVLRAKMPQYQVGCIMFAIIINVASTYSPQFSQMAQAETFVRHLLTAILTGLAVATGVSLLIFPLTSREVVFNDMRSYITGIQSAMSANMTYVESLESTDMFASQRTNTQGMKPPRSPEAEAFQKKMQGVAATQAKLATNLPFAKREVALGKLGPDDIAELFKLLREIVVPIVGLSSMSLIFERISEDRGWDRSKSFATATPLDATNEAEQARIAAVNEWHELIRLLKEPFGSLTDTIKDGLQHCLIVLQLSPKSQRIQKLDDQEATGDSPKPGDKEFGPYLYRRSEDFHESKKMMLRGWCRLHGIELPADFFNNPYVPDIKTPSWMHAQDQSEAHSRTKRQLLLMLYIEFILYAISRRTYNAVKFVDELSQSGKLKKTRLIVPGYKRLRKWFYSAFKEQDVDEDGYNESKTVYLGQAYEKRKDPEHLPPVNAWERFSNIFRTMSHFFASPASIFGFRVACATMSIAVVNYLRDTQIFFTHQRLFWAQIMASIAMAPSAGQSLRTLFFRMLGTFGAMILAFIAYYIVDGETAGILVFYFVFLNAGMYILVKYPAISPIGMISMITLTLILGYSLQARKIGIQRVEANGQAYYPIYELGPIRLATVAAGLFVGWVFTIFPYPVSEHSQLRRNLGSTLYLLANFYSVVHETVRMRLQGTEGDMSLKDSPGQRLIKVRHKLLTKCNVLISGLRTQASFVVFDIPTGGKFPLAQYQELIERLQNVLNFITLISVASITFSGQPGDVEKEPGWKWRRGLAAVVSEANLTSQSVTTLLSLLSSAIKNGQPLPPYLRTPEPFLLSAKLDKLDNDILSVQHIAEPGYASFAVIQIGTQCLVDDLKELLAGVKNLVGELDFSFHIVSTADSSKNDSEETLTYTAARSADGDRAKQE